MIRQPLKRNNQRQEDRKRRTRQRKRKHILDTDHIRCDHLLQIIPAEHVLNVGGAGAQDQGDIVVTFTGEDGLEHPIGEEGLCDGDEVSSAKGLTHCGEVRC